MMDIYAVECHIWPWMSRRKAADMLREQHQAHSKEVCDIVFYATQQWWGQCQEIGQLTQKIRSEIEVRWAPYQEFGITPESWESHDPPSVPILIKTTGYRGNVIVLYWLAA